MSSSQHRRILYVATVVKTHIMEFHIPYLKMLKEMGWETAVAARNDYENPADCIIPYCDVYYDIPFERNPLKLGNRKAYKQLKKIIDEGQYDIIHCHTPVGAMLTRLAAEEARKKGSKVIYTAHGFHFYKGAPIKNWIAYYPVEKWLAKKTDVLITINKEDYERAKKKLKTPYIEYVPGVGVDMSRFRRASSEKSSKREELGINESDFVLLSVGELIKRKNHKVVIKALSELKTRGELDGLQYLVCGRGVLSDELKQLAERLGVSEHVHFLGYRDDISAICNCCDVFVFMSYHEGLPVALLEALACGLPAICSNIRGNTDLVRDKKNGFFAKNRSKALANMILSYKANPALVSDHSEEINRNNDYLKVFDINNTLQLVKKVYQDTIV